MSNWLIRARALGDIAVQLHAVITLIGIVLGTFGVAVAVMSYVLNSIAELSKYGWGLPVVAAIGIVLIIVVVLSFAAVPAVTAYRRWRPYHEPNTDKVEPGTVAAVAQEIDDRAEPAPWRAELESRLREMWEESLIKYDESRAEQLVAIKGDVKRLTNKTEELDRKMEDLLGRDMARLKVLTKLQFDSANSDRRFGYLIHAMHARAAGARVKEHDQIVCSLGPKLISAADYNDRDSWLRDYETWHDRLATIDEIIGSFGGEDNKPFLSIRHDELQKCAEMPPESIRDDSVIIPFKTVCLAQRRYAALRDNVATFFKTKGALPG